MNAKNGLPPPTGPQASSKTGVPFSMPVVECQLCQVAMPRMQFQASIKCHGEVVHTLACSEIPAIVFQCWSFSVWGCGKNYVVNGLVSWLLDPKRRNWINSKVRPTSGSCQPTVGSSELALSPSKLMPWIPTRKEWSALNPNYDPFLWGICARLGQGPYINSLTIAFARASG